MGYYYNGVTIINPNKDLIRIIDDLDCQKIYIGIDGLLVEGNLSEIIIKEGINKGYISPLDKIKYYLAKALNFIVRYNKLSRNILDHLLIKYAFSIETSDLYKYIKKDFVEKLKYICSERECYTFSREPKPTQLILIQYLRNNEGVIIKYGVGSNSKKKLYNPRDKFEELERAIEKEEGRVCVISRFRP